jgi:glycosyltransferase involved in cell wall biosynthesis
MRILILAPQPFFQHRGSPIAVKLLAEVLSNDGHRIDILTYHEGQEVEISDVKVHRIPPIPGLNNIRPGPSWKKLFCDVVLFWCCLNLLRKRKFDIIHAVEESVFIAIVMKALFRIPIVYDMDSSIPQQIADKYKVPFPVKHILQLLEKMALKASLAVVAVCKILEETATQYVPPKAVLRLEDISLLHSGDESGDILRKELDIAGPIIMYIGNLEKYQGIALLLESFRLVSERIPAAELVIIGGSDRDIEKFSNLSRELGIKKRTHLIGRRPVSHLGFYLVQADILVSPRLQGNNTPMKIYSYLDARKPVLATRLPTHTQILDDQVALLVKPEPQAMADGLVKLIIDQDFARGIASRAKERVRQEFSYKTFQKKLTAFYRTLDTEIVSN